MRTCESGGNGFGVWLTVLLSRWGSIEVEQQDLGWFAGGYVQSFLFTHRHGVAAGELGAVDSHFAFSDVNPCQIYIRGVCVLASQLMWQPAKGALPVAPPQPYLQ